MAIRRSRAWLWVVWFILLPGTLGLSLYIAAQLYRWSRLTEIPAMPFPGDVEQLRAEVPPSESNAADLYRAALDMATQPLTVALNLPPSTPESEELVAQRRRKLCDLVEQAASLHYAVFYPPQDLGWNFLVPEADALHRLLPLLLEHAASLQDQGKSDDALDVYLAMIRMARHMEHKSFLMFRAVAEARVERMAHEAILEWCNADGVDQELLRTAIERLTLLDSQTPPYEETILVKCVDVRTVLPKS